ncbi:hypothetical protein SAMN06265371_106224 [Lutibacter agarilyticus]|uniref:Uncharacterized protein n=2 Tax=Lutibacter agarilyticus TaxID=1109740 RepID=A0A238XQR7_9FLAO|nr:hypothetical protein SAMN06265371_106224 [Lutibacter agarilyticus]
MIIGLFILGIGYLYSFASGVKNDSINKRYELKLKDSIILLKITNGLWIHSEDSLATVKIDGFQWIFQYKNEITDSTDIYDYQIIDKTIENKIKSLTLTNKSDTLEYELDYLTDKNMTLIYLPRGNFHNYTRID